MKWRIPAFSELYTPHRARLGFIALLAVCAGVVLLQTAGVRVLRFAPLHEYRTPAKFPDVVAKVLHGDGRLAHDINRWFDDRMGFRPVLTRFANQVDYSVFSASKKVLIASDGWLFDKDYFMVTIASARSDDGLAGVREKMAAAAQYLERRNIKFVVIGTPAKETIYPERLPYGTPSIPAVTEFQKFREFLKAGSGRGWTYLDSQDVFARIKNDKPDIYFKTDLHSTRFGTFTIAKQVVNHIAEAEGVSWRWAPKTEMVPGELSFGAGLRYLSVFSDLTEAIQDLKDLATPENPPPGASFESKPAPPFEVIFHAGSHPAPLPRIVLFGSSFLDDYLAVGAYANFADVYRMRGVSNDIGTALAAIPPGTRYFVYQFWEPHFSALRYAKIPAN